MSMFRARRKALVTNSQNTEAINQLKVVVSRWARHLAIKLSKYERTMSRRSKVVAISCFCITMSLFSMNLLYRGLFGHQARQQNFPVGAGISIPRTPQLSDSVLANIRSRRTYRNPHSKPSNDSLTK